MLQEDTLIKIFKVLFLSLTYHNPLKEVVERTRISSWVLEIVVCNLIFELFSCAFKIRWVSENLAVRWLAEERKG